MEVTNMAAIEVEKMDVKVKEFLSRAKPGQLFNFCEGELIDGTRSITVYEVQNGEWMVECRHCRNQQYSAPNCRACGKELTSSSSSGPGRSG